MILNISQERGGSNVVFYMDTFKYRFDSGEWGYLADIMLTKDENDLFIPIIKPPVVLPVLHVIVSRFMDLGRPDILLDGKAVDMSDLRGIDFGYKNGESYRDSDEVLALGACKGLSRSYVCLCSGVDASLVDKVRSMISPKMTA